MNPFLKLPRELLEPIISHLANRDIKNLRLSCSFFLERAKLRLNRVFLSPNPRNIEVFRAVADHPIWCNQVVEIIWDDAWLGECWIPEDPRGLYSDTRYYRWESPPDGIPRWWWTAMKESVSDMKDRRYNDAERPIHRAVQEQIDDRMPPERCYSYYQELKHQQDEVIASGADYEALKYGLSRFPSLRKVTVTAAAHGWLFTPLYETPMIREFPKGFKYPIPRGWPSRKERYGEGVQPNPQPWTDATDAANEKYKNQWRGFRMVTNLLATESHNVKELILDTHGIETGINCRVFEERSREYEDIATILKTPGFRRIDLALIACMRDHHEWKAFRNGNMRRALAEAQHLEHIRFETDLEGFDITDENFIPLKTIFPVDKWPRLQHFALSQFLVKQSDVIAFLRCLPPTLTSLELSDLHFVDDCGCYRDLLSEMRDTLSWQQRPVLERPHLAVGWHVDYGYHGRVVWVNKEVNDFLYHDGPNPFNQLDGHYITPGESGIEEDPFDSSWERPHTDDSSLIEMGILGRCGPDYDMPNELWNMKIIAQRPE